MRLPLATLAASFALLAACDAAVPATDARMSTPPPIAVTPPPGGADPSTFRERVFYELWVRSFQDGDGDGIGDFAGLESRLDELAELGIGGLWLMPTFPSPLRDSGYDVADYKGVHPDYGTVTDLARVIDAAHERGMLVWLDMVFNHVSDEHPWFQSALTGPASPTWDWFVWNSEPATRCVDVPNALTPFGTDRWTWSDSAGAWYFHQFYPRQPDLNFRNPAVQEALLDVLRHWMDLGVDGFRFDVPDRYFESGERCAMQPETVAFHGRMRELIAGRGTLERGFVGEIWGVQDEVRTFLGPDADPAIFAFEWMASIWTGAVVGESGRVLAEAARTHLHGLPEESRWGLILGNHDTPRVGTVGSGDVARLKLAAALQMTLPGIPFMWAGEELGLEMGDDVLIDGRDGARTPFPWEADAPGLGFTSAEAPFLGFSADSRRKARDMQVADPDSLWNAYRRLIMLRNGDAALQGPDYRELAADGDIYVFERGKGAERRIVAFNLSRVTPRRWYGEGGWARDLLGGGRHRLSDLDLPPQTVRILDPTP